MAIDLYFWPTPNGWKITIALEEMGLPYDLKLVNLGRGEQFGADFLRLAPNNRMPAITDPDGPDGTPISIFESGAILQYLARKTGQFGGRNAREQSAVEQWLMWQMAGLGPMAGQAHHFLQYAPALDPPQDLPYAKDRYTRELARLYDVLDKQLAQSEFVAGPNLSIADFAIWPWAILRKRQGQNPQTTPNLTRWITQLGQRPAVQRGKAAGAEHTADPRQSEEAKRILFGASPKT